MKVKMTKVPVAFEPQLIMQGMEQEFQALRDLLEDNITFYPSLRPLLGELNFALTGWSAPIEAEEPQ
jgi:hypothetical protein